MQMGLFVVSLAVFFIGDVALGRWIARSSGYTGYSNKMVMAFYLIYYMVSDVQVRLGLVQMEGFQRLLCSFVQPLMFTILRFRITRWWKKFGRNTDADERVLMEKPRVVILCVMSMMTQNINAALVSGVACIFKGVDGMQLGVCENPMFLQIAIDSWSTWVFDCASIAMLVRIKMPVLYVFLLLDFFLVIAAVVVTYVNVMLALLTGIINL